MIKKSLPAAALCFAALSLPPSQAAVLLSPGDISIIGYSSDGTDQIAFVSWVNLDATTTVSFTDRGWRNTTQSFTKNPSENPASVGLVPSDGNVSWTSGAAIAAGTIIVGTVHNNNPDTLTWNIGTSTGDFGNTGLGGFPGESLFAYQGAPSAPALLFGLYYFAPQWDTVDPGEYSTNSSQLPSVLNTSIGNIAPPSSATVKNGYYSGPVSNQGNLIDYRAQVLNKANWTVYDGDPTDNLASQFAGGAFTTVPEPSAFILGFAGLLGLSRRRR